MMALRYMSHVLYRQSSANFFKKYQAGVRVLSSHNSINFASKRLITMASQYIPVEKGTPNSTNYRVYYSKFVQDTSFFSHYSVSSLRAMETSYFIKFQSKPYRIVNKWKLHKKDCICTMTYLQSLLFPICH